MVDIGYIGHATVVIDMGPIRIMTDPVLRDRLFFLQRHGQSPARDLLGEHPPEVVLLSHLHYDHADLPSLRRLPATTKVIAPTGSASYLARWAGVDVLEMAEGDTAQFGQVEISALPADHGMAFSVPRPMTECLSYVIRDDLSVYFAGDTDLFQEMEGVGRAFDLDLALLPVWGYSHRVGAGHLTPLTAAHALTRLRPCVAVPIHWGALRFMGPGAFWERVDYLSSPPYAFAEFASRLAPQTKVRVLQPGEWTTLE
ncbi:MBL fold metallo-hydrolase [Chloroflexota bacterium]